MSESDIAAFKLGKEAEVFIQSDLGKYIDGCSKQDMESAKQALLDLDPYAFKDLVELQNKIVSLQTQAKLAMKVIDYFAETINRGKQAEHQLETEEDNG
ncbi:MAG: hypothetical protein NUV80_06165 [Candidatus Berkelbacteria bacterium]|nr:hypothetical protein [Candidatus Berkelbacteria bacterium]